MVNITGLDWTIIIVFLVMVIGIGSAAAWRSSKSASDFFLSGRSMPWWLLGVSMVACTFSCDTPNLVTDMVRSGGVSKNWAWWAFLLTGMMTVFIYAKLWRRSELNTDLGFYEIRYSGTPAAVLRGFRALYLGIFFNVLIMATVSLAAIKIGQVMFGLSPVVSLVAASFGVAIYATLGGLTGSIWADFFQYSVAMLGAFFAAIYAVTSEDVGHVGSLTQLFSDATVQSKLAFFPAVSDGAGDYSNFVTLLILPIAVQWWNVWYPGAEPGGGGYIAQRMLSAKDEKNAIGATLLFNFLHYAVRPWPWIIVALVSLTQFPMDVKPAADAWLAEHKDVVARYHADKSTLTPKQIETVEYWIEGATYLPAAEAQKLIAAAKAAETQTKAAVADAEAKVAGLGVDAISDLAAAAKAAPAAKVDDKVQLAAENLAGLKIAFPEVDRQFLKHDIAYPGMISKMPKGWLGLIVASLIAAYMSTIATHLNWGSSYFVQDFWVRFVEPDCDPKKAVTIGRISMLALLVLSSLVALCMQNAMDSFNILLQIGAGTGLLYILRWFWWRINAWSEISAMVISFIVALLFRFFGPAWGIEEAFKNAGMFKIMDYTSWQLVIGITVTTIGWVLVTYLTRPEPDSVLIAFCRKIRAGGPGWARFAKDVGPDAAGWDMPACILCMVIGCLAVWTALFGAGCLVYTSAAPMFGALSNSVMGIVLLVISVASTITLMKIVTKIKLS